MDYETTGVASCDQPTTSLSEECYYDGVTRPIVRENRDDHAAVVAQDQGGFTKTAACPIPAPPRSHFPPRRYAPIPTTLGAAMSSGTATLGHVTVRYDRAAPAGERFTVSWSGNEVRRLGGRTAARLLAELVGGGR